MEMVIRVRNGLDINLVGAAQGEKSILPLSTEYALVPDAFVGVTPKIAVKEGDIVKAGDALFVNKQQPDVKFASPVSGVVTAVERGERRKVLCVKVKADAEQQYADFGKKDLSSMNAAEVVSAIVEAGLFGYVTQLPYAVVANPSDTPKAIFVSALRDMPLACDFEIELKGNEAAFQTGLDALSKIALVLSRHLLLCFQQRMLRLPYLMANVLQEMLACKLIILILLIRVRWYGQLLQQL